MRRIVCTGFGDPLELIEEPTPPVGPDDVLIEVEAAGASFVDGLIVSGGYQLRPDLPFTPGSVLAGRVVERGAAVVSVTVGARVACVGLGLGGYVTHSVRPADQVVVLPDGVRPEIAASAAENYSTMLFAVTHRVRIEPGEQVVVLGAGGSIGLAAVDVARSLGARVVAVASSEAKQAAALAAGADVAIGYDDLKNAIRSVTGGGADVVIDPVGGEQTEPALRALDAGGRLCVIGFAAGDIPRLPMNLVLLRNRSVVGVDWGDWLRGDAPAGRELFADVLTRIAAGELHPPEPQPVPLADAGSLLASFADRTATGKYVLTPR